MRTKLSFIILLSTFFVSTYGLTAEIAPVISAKKITTQKPLIASYKATYALIHQGDVVGKPLDS